jgi:hypothetical protein
MRSIWRVIVETHCRIGRLILCTTRLGLLIATRALSNQWGLRMFRMVSQVHQSSKLVRLEALQQ